MPTHAFPLSSSDPSNLVLILHHHFELDRSDAQEAARDAIACVKDLAQPRVPDYKRHGHYAKLHATLKKICAKLPGNSGKAGPRWLERLERHGGDAYYHGLKVSGSSAWIIDSTEPSKLLLTVFLQYTEDCGELMFSLEFPEGEFSPWWSLPGDAQLGPFMFVGKAGNFIWQPKN